MIKKLIILTFIIILSLDLVAALEDFNFLTYLKKFDSQKSQINVRTYTTNPAEFFTGNKLVWGYKFNNRGEKFKTNVCFFLKHPNNNIQEINSIENYEIGTTNQEIFGDIGEYIFNGLEQEGNYELITQLRKNNVKCSDQINAAEARDKIIAESTNFIGYNRLPSLVTAEKTSFTRQSINDLIQLLPPTEEAPINGRIVPTEPFTQEKTPQLRYNFNMGLSSSRIGAVSLNDVIILNLQIRGRSIPENLFVSLEVLIPENFEYVSGSLKRNGIPIPDPITRSPSGYLMSFRGGEQRVLKILGGPWTNGNELITYSLRMRTIGSWPGNVQAVAALTIDPILAQMAAIGPFSVEERGDSRVPLTDITNELPRDPKQSTFRNWGMSGYSFNQEIHTSKIRAAQQPQPPQETPTNSRAALSTRDNIVELRENERLDVFVRYKFIKDTDHPVSNRINAKYDIWLPFDVGLHPDSRIMIDGSPIEGFTQGYIGNNLHLVIFDREMRVDEDWHELRFSLITGSIAEPEKRSVMLSQLTLNNLLIRDDSYGPLIIYGSQPNIRVIPTTPSIGFDGPLEGGTTTVTTTCLPDEICNDNLDNNCNRVIDEDCGSSSGVTTTNILPCTFENIGSNFVGCRLSQPTNAEIINGYSCSQNGYDCYRCREGANNVLGSCEEAPQLTIDPPQLPQTDINFGAYNLDVPESITGNQEFDISTTLIRRDNGPEIEDFEYDLLLPPGFDYVDGSVRFDNNPFIIIERSNDADGIRIIKIKLTYPKLTYPEENNRHVINWRIKGPEIILFEGSERIVGKFFGRGLQLNMVEKTLNLILPRESDPVSSFIPLPFQPIDSTLEIRPGISIFSISNEDIYSQRRIDYNFMGTKKVIRYNGNTYYFEIPAGILSDSWRGVIIDVYGHIMNEMFGLTLEDNVYNIYDRNNNRVGKIQCSEVNECIIELPSNLVN